MWRAVAVIASGLLISACGGGVDSYEDAIDEYAAVMQDMVDVLEDVTDESSAEKAVGEIEKLGNRIAEITAKVEDLPQPSAEEMRELASKQGDIMQGFQDDVTTQMFKMAQYPVLMEAWMNAMSNMD